MAPFAPSQVALQARKSHRAWTSARIVGVRPAILHSHDHQQSQADVSCANQSRIHSATQNSCAVSHVHCARRPRKKAEEVTRARSGRVVAVAQEALTPARIRRGLREASAMRMAIGISSSTGRNKNIHKNFISNPIACHSKSDGAHTAGWSRADAHRPIRIIP
jgi:hypothetical protein